MSVAAAARPSTPTRRSLSVAIIGAGFGGIAAAIELRRAGFDDVRILEKAPDLGGTWFYNSYPGCACDVPSHLYSFSYAQRRDWSRLCSPQAEIHDYLQDVARAHGVDRLIESPNTVTSCTWVAERSHWRIETSEGASLQADAIVLATGQLHQPAYPAIEGIERFAGTSFHSSQWDHGYSLAGKRVAVVGTGASAVQFIPEIAREVRHLTVFQRTGNWFLPRKNRAYPAFIKAAVEHVPGVQAFRRQYMFQYCESLTLAIRHPNTVGRLLHARSAAFMRYQLKDAALRRRAWPDYTFGCKRILFSSHFLPALERANVDLVTDPIARVSAEGLVTSDGGVHELDCIIWATGFKTNDFMFPMEIHGVDDAELRTSWAGGAHAHLGISVPGYPNMFIMYGPNTNTSGGSIIVYLEAQAAYLRQALEQLRTRNAAAIEVRAEAEAASDRALQSRFAGTAWTQCDSWYRDERGRIVANWPGYMREYLEQTNSLKVADYRFTPLAQVAGATPAAVAQSGRVGDSV
jgi:cation diffusion facilitator CzcD-associated flavoprotein CzcO